MGLVERVANQWAFFPPTPPYYDLRDVGGAHKVMHSRWLDPGASQHQYRVLELATQKREQVVAVYVPAPQQTRLTLLFSHGNAVDIGQLVPFFRQLASVMRLNVLGYDYSGYGCSTGSPSVSNTIADIDACYAWLLQQGFKASDVILYGQSVGSGPAINLAARTHGMAGVILHSPLLSGMQVMKPEWRWWPAWADIYPNQALVAKITAPVLIMHGTEDDVVGISHGRKLHSLLQNPYPPLWAQHKGHQDLETAHDFLPTLRDFANSCRQAQS